MRHPGRFTTEVVFRRCEKCGERNVVKDDWYVCGVCGEALPAEWNFRWMAKVKTTAYLKRLRGFFLDDWKKYGE